LASSLEAARTADVLARLGLLVVLLGVGGGALDDGGGLGTLLEGAALEVDVELVPESTFRLFGSSREVPWPRDGRPGPA